MTSRLPKTDGTPLTTPHAFTATRSARSVTRISPPAPRVPRPSSGNGFLRRRRVLVELRSLVGTRQKPIRAGSLPSRPVPTLRDTHCPTPTHLVLAIPVPQGSDFDEHRLQPTRSYVRLGSSWNPALRPATACAFRGTVFARTPHASLRPAAEARPESARRPAARTRRCRTASRGTRSCRCHPCARRSRLPHSPR